MSHNKIKHAIKNYSKAYQALQYWQDNHHAIPGGDQKTGSIDEYYAYLHLSIIYPNAILNYGSHTEKGWDIDVFENGLSTKVQVKTVSKYSKTRTISPIHKGWDLLYLIYVGFDMLPNGFWIIEDTSIFGPLEVLRSKKCPVPDKVNTGSRGMGFSDNIVDSLNESINSY